MTMPPSSKLVKDLKDYILDTLALSHTYSRQRSSLQLRIDSLYNRLKALEEFVLKEQ